MSEGPWLSGEKTVSSHNKIFHLKLSKDKVKAFAMAATRRWDKRFSVVLHEYVHAPPKTENVFMIGMPCTNSVRLVLRSTNSFNIFTDGNEMRN